MSVVTILFGLIAQRVFINTLGTEYLGINGLFTSIVSMLALAELGLGSAIYYHLYKPIASGDTAKVSSLVNFYKKGYRLIALAVLFIGMLMLPFLETIVGDVNVAQNIYVIYILFVLDIVFSYLLTYKRAVLFVDQKNYIISMVHLGYLIALNTLQIAGLLMTGNFYLYLLIKIIMRLAENVVLTIITNRKYKYLANRPVIALDGATKSEIYKKVRGLSYHKIGSYVVLGTDNIIISLFFGITAVGLYSNYYLVIGAISMIIGQLFTALIASVGNLLVKAKSSQSYDVYGKIRLANFWIGCFAATAVLVTMDSFITVWIGSQYLLPLSVLVALSINLYVTLIRSAINSFKEAAGIFHEDRFVPIIEAVANIVFSLVLLHFFGLAGVFLGTACSTLVLHLYSYPKFVYKPLFKQPYKVYYSELIKNSAFAVVIAAATFAISRSITADSNFAQFLINVALCLTIPNIALYLLFRNSDELNYYVQLAKDSLQHLKNQKVGK